MVQHIPGEVTAEWERSSFVALGLQVTLRKCNIILVKTEEVDATKSAGRAFIKQLKVCQR